MPPVHVAITRQVKPGCEEEFESALLHFIAETMSCPGVLGAQILRPAPGGAAEYGILRGFTSEEARDAFYSSPQFRAWEEQVAHLVADSWRQRPLHGLEAFFRGEAQHPPPRWKMALLTWVGVFPSALLYGNLVHGLLPGLPATLTTALATALVVVTLAWAIMPLLTRLFQNWLHH